MTVTCNWCTLKVDNNNMHALMCLNAHTNEEEHPLTEQLVLDFLKSLDIVYGINNIAINSLLESVPYEQYVCVAQGLAPTRGSDAHFDFKKSTQDMKKKPLILENGTADYKNSLNLATITEGELLAEYIPPTDGSEGMDICGNTLPSLGKGKDILPLRGRGIIPDSTNTKFFAEYSGHIVMDGPKIYIDKLYRVNGDLDIEIGNINFDGDVEVQGDVRSGLSIDAKGSIFIHGHVGACILKAGKNITIEKGIQGRGSCIIEASEDIACKFVESCNINAGGNIYADSVLNSTLIAQKQILVTSKNGNVISSEVYGMTGVIVKEAGNSAGVPTLLRAGLPREYYTRYSELNKLILESDEKTAAFNHHLELLEESGKDNPNPKIADTRMQIMRAKIVLSSKRNEYLEELDELSDKIKLDSQNSYINITGTIYEGVRIYIGTYPYLINEAVKEVTFKVSNNEVIMSSLTE